MMQFRTRGGDRFRFLCVEGRCCRASIVVRGTSLRRGERGETKGKSYVDCARRAGEVALLRVTPLAVSSHNMLFYCYGTALKGRQSAGTLGVSPPKQSPHVAVRSQK